MPTRSQGGELVIEVRAAAVNRSDALACRGVLPGPFPRVLGRDFAGVVVDGPTERIGERVWGTGGGDLGLTRDGSHAQYLLAPLDAVALIPPNLSFVDAAASGLAYFTASHALARAGRIEHGAVVVVTGVAGGVGSAAAHIAAWRGATVVGVVKDATEAALLDRGVVTHVVTSDVGQVAEHLLEASNGHGAHLGVDAVGGRMAAAVLGGLSVGGGLCVVSTPPSDAVVAVDMLDFYRRELRLVGLHTGRLTAADAAAVLRDLAPGFVEGRLKPAPVQATYSLDDAAQAYAAVERGVHGRPVFLPHDS